MTKLIPENTDEYRAPVPTSGHIKQRLLSVLAVTCSSSDRLTLGASNLAVKQADSNAKLVSS